MEIFQILSQNKEFSYSFKNYHSQKFSTELDCLISILEFSLKQNLLLIHLRGFSISICNKIDTFFGKSFKNKFQFAHMPINEFINQQLFSASKEPNFEKKLLHLISPFHKISYEHKEIITLHLPDTKNPSVEHFFNSKKQFKSENNHIFSKNDISFFSDASCDKFTTLAGAAIKNKKMISCFRFHLPYEDNNLSELRAIYHTVLLAQAMQQQHLLIYTDNSNAIDFLSGKSKITDKNKDFFAVTHQIISELSYFSSFCISWIPRKKNFIADNLSKNDFDGHFFVR